MSADHADPYPGGGQVIPTITQGAAWLSVGAATVAILSMVGPQANILASALLSAVSVSAAFAAVMSAVVLAPPGHERRTIVFGVLLLLATACLALWPWIADRVLFGHDGDVQLDCRVKLAGSFAERSYLPPALICHGPVGTDKWISATPLGVSVQLTVGVVAPYLAALVSALKLSRKDRPLRAQ